MHITVKNGMINIEGKQYDYTNLRGVRGSGLQVEDELLEQEDEVRELMDSLANILYKLTERYGE